MITPPFLDTLSRCGGSHAFYMRPAGGEAVFSASAERFPSASIIKVPILLTYVHLAQAGEVDLDEPVDLDSQPQVGGAGFARHLRARRLPLADVLLMMIATSDNLCTNLAIARVGRERLNDLFRRVLGLESTELQRSLMDLEARARGLDNWIGARDCIRLYDCLRALPPARREWVDRVLLACEDSSLLLRGIPRDSLHFHHKTGSIPGVLHDWGYTRGCEMFLLTSGLPDEAQANAWFEQAGLLLLAA